MSDNNQTFEKVVFSLPKNLKNKLEAIGDIRGISVSRLVAIAIDNEFTDSKVPFQFNTALPETEFIEYAYAEEARRICDFISKVKSGLGREELLLARGEMGIESRSVFLHAYRELLRAGIIEEYQHKLPGYLKMKRIHTATRIKK